MGKGKKYIVLLAVFLLMVSTIALVTFDAVGNHSFAFTSVNQNVGFSIGDVTIDWDVDGSMMTGIPLGSTVQDVLGGIHVSGTDTATVKYQNGSAVNLATNAGTGMIVELNDGQSVFAQYTLVIMGDITGDGLCTALDLLKMKKHLLKQIVLEGAYAKAANTNGDAQGALSVLDLLGFKKQLLGMIDVGPTPAPTPTAVPGGTSFFFSVDDVAKTSLAVSSPGVALFDSAKEHTGANTKLTECGFDLSILNPPTLFLNKWADPSVFGQDDYQTYFNTVFAQEPPTTLFLDTRDVYYNVKEVTQQEIDTMVYPYFDNLLTMRKFAADKGLPFRTLMSAKRLKIGQMQTATSLTFQAFASLGVGASGISWAGYFGDMYAPLDGDDDETSIWYELQDTNRRYQILAQKMNGLTVNRTYFVNLPDARFPQLSNYSTYLQKVDYIAQEVPKTGATPIPQAVRDIPLMITECSGADGSLWMYVLNLSTSYSTKPSFVFISGIGLSASNMFEVSQSTGALNREQKPTDLSITAGSARLYKVKS